MWQIRSILQQRWCCPRCLFRWPHSPSRCYSDVHQQAAQAKSHLAPSCLQLMHDTYWYPAFYIHLFKCNPASDICVFSCVRTTNKYVDYMNFYKNFLVLCKICWWHESPLCLFCQLSCSPLSTALAVLKLS